jgi:chromosome segregation ATPase
MKTYRNHHTRNRTRRRRMKGGGYNLDRMLDNIRIIKSAQIDNFAEGLGKLKELVKEAQDREFIDAIPAFNKVGLNESVDELVASYDDVKYLDPTPEYPPGKQLVPYPEKFNRIKAAVIKFEEVVYAVKNKSSSLAPAAPPAPPAPEPVDVSLNTQADQDPQRLDSRFRSSIQPIVSGIDPQSVKAKKINYLQGLSDLSGVQSKEEEEVLKTLNESDNKSLCEINYPKVYRILASGKFNGSSIISLLNRNNSNDDNKLLAFFRAVGYDHQTKTIKGRSIAEIYRACHPNISKKRPEDVVRLANVFQVLTALNNFTGIKEKILPLPSNIYSNPAGQLQAQTTKPGRPDRKVIGVPKPDAPLPVTTSLPVAPLPQAPLPQLEPVAPLPEATPLVAGPLQAPPAIPTRRILKEKASLAVQPSLQSPIAPVTPYQSTPAPALETTVPQENIERKLREVRPDGQVPVTTSQPALLPSPPSVASAYLPALLKPYDKSAPLTQPAFPAGPENLESSKRARDLRPTGQSVERRPLDVPCDIKLEVLRKSCDDDLARLRAQLEKVQQDKDAEIAKLSANISEQKDNLTKLQGEKTDIEGQIAQKIQLIEILTKNIERFTKDISKRRELEDKKAQLEAELKAEREKNQQQSATISRIAGQIQSLNTRIYQFDKENKRLKAEHDQQTLNLEAAEASLADLNSRFEFTNNLIDQAQQVIREELDEVSKKLGKGIETITGQLESLGMLTANVDRRLWNVTRAFNGKLEALNAQLKEAEANDNSRKQEILDAIKALKEQNAADMAILRDELAKLTGENTDLQEKLREQTNAKATADGQVLAMQKQIEDLKREHEAALEQARQLAEKTARDVEIAKEAAVKANNEALAAQTAAAEAATKAKDAAIADKANALISAAAAEREFRRLSSQSTAAAAKAERLNAEQASALKDLSASLNSAMQRAVTAREDSVKLSTLQNQLTEVKEALVKNTDTTQELRSIIQTCNENLANMTERANTCDKNLAGVTEQLKAALAAHALESARLNQENDQYKQQLVQLNSEKAKVQSDLATNKERLEQVRKLFSENTVQLQGFESRIKELTSQKTLVERDLAVEKQRSAGEKQKLDASLANITQQLNTVTQEKTALTQEITNIQTQIKTLQTVITDLNGQFTATNKLIADKSDEISEQIKGNVAHFDAGIQTINTGIGSVSKLVTDASTILNESRREFREELDSIKAQLQAAATNKAEQDRLKADIKSLTDEFERESATLNAAKVASEAELNRLKVQLASETAAKEQAQRDFDSAQQTARVVAQQNAAALESSRQQAEAAFAQFTAAAEKGLGEEKERFRVQAELNLETLRTGLVAEREAAVANANSERKADIDRQITELNEKIDTLQRKSVVPALPELIRRYPDGDVPENSIITIYWNSNGTTGPWILRIEYSEGGILQFTDFQEVRPENKNTPIQYKIKRSGDLSGTIYNVTEID